jgi:hypothetical protein
VTDGSCGIGACFALNAFAVIAAVPSTRPNQSIFGILAQEKHRFNRQMTDLLNLDKTGQSLSENFTARTRVARGDTLQQMASEQSMVTAKMISRSTNKAITLKRKKD